MATRVTDFERTRIVRRRRVLGATVLIVVLLLIVAALAGDGRDFFEKVGADPAGRASDGTAGEGPQLPGGGRQIFPDKRVVAFYGAPQDEALGTLGIGPPQEATDRLAKQSKPYERGGRPVLPALELIATIAGSSRGEDGRYRTRQKQSVVRRYLEAAREAGMLLVLDIQPGRSDFMSEVRVYEEFLREPDVSLALDPEWHVGPGELPGETIGSVTAAEVNEVAAYLSGIVREGNLPQKLLVVHQFTEGMIRDRAQLERHQGVALTLNVDGFGTGEQKLAKYDDFTGGDSSSQPAAARNEPHPTPPASERPPGAVEPAPQSDAGSSEAPAERSDGSDPSETVPPGTAHHGFKLFYEEDTDLLTPRDVLRLRPEPELVVYE